MRKIVILILIIVSAVTSGLVYAARAGKPQFKGVEYIASVPDRMILYNTH